LHEYAKNPQVQQAPSTTTAGGGGQAQNNTQGNVIYFQIVEK
jgi:hypothetical protein